MIQIKVIEASGKQIEDPRIGWYFKVTKSLEDNVNEFLATIPEDKIIDIDYEREEDCIITYLK